MNRIVAVSGHYGSGKTEFAVNLALRQAGRGETVTVADLDIVNPYFRSREKRSLLEEAGVTVIGSSTGSDSGADVPALSAQVYAPLQNREVRTILDVGGDAAGARLLARFKHYLTPGGFDLLAVVNTNRPETRDTPGVLEHIRAIQGAVGRRVTGLVNNSHMLEFTQVYHVEEGDAVCRAVGAELGIPVVYLAAREALLPALPESLAGERIGVAMYLRESWMYA
jgi:hypothetical protein